MPDHQRRSSSNTSANPSLRDLLSRSVDRRRVLTGGGLGALAVTFVGTGAFARGVTPPTANTANTATVPPPGMATAGAAAAAAAGAASVLGFAAVAPSTDDTVVVPEGYEAQVLIPWGTPLASSGPEWLADGTNTAEDQARQVGSHHDGMFLFPVGDHDPNRRGLLVLNHEYTDVVTLYADGDAEITPEKVAKALEAHGVTVIEIELVEGTWRPVDGDLNRRVTMTTPVEFAGPVTADHPQLQSAAAPTGTLNNCGSGRTPWGTYLTCEENFHQYFGTTDEDYELTAQQERYGIGVETDYRWHEADPRFDIAVNPNEPNRFGWVVEIDPHDPASTPVKRTALGRFKHESAWVHDAGGTVVVYSGDDEDGEYLYKFVSAAPWQPAVDAGRSPLDDGTLYVARFDDDGTGEWLPLVWGRHGLTRNGGFEDQADVLVRTREAADRVGATALDRPEWIAEHAATGDLYVTFTNGTNGANPINPRQPNPFGHIVRWTPTGGDHTSTTFDWAVFVLAGDPSYDPEVTIDGDAFGSPDGLWIDPDGRMWIETDVSNSSQLLEDKGYDHLGNNQLLAADLATGEVRRFLVGPRGAEVTGLTVTPDRTTMFVNIQHPGEATEAWGAPTADDPTAVSSWPDGSGRPRSATVAIRKLDGGIIGS